MKHIAAQRVQIRDVKSDSCRKRLILISLPYLFSYLVYLGGPLVFELPSLFGVAVLILGAATGGVAYRIGYKSTKISAYTIQNHSSLSIAYISYMRICAIPIFALAVGFLGWYVAQGASVELLISQTSQVRSETSATGILKIILGIGAYQAYVFIPILMSRWRHHFPVRVQLLYTISILIMAYVVVLQAGRTIFLVFGVLLFCVFIVYRVGERPLLYKDAFVRGVAIAFVAIGIPMIIFIGTNRVLFSEMREGYAALTLRYGKDLASGLSIEKYYGALVNVHYLSGQWENFDKLARAQEDVFAIGPGPFGAVARRLMPTESASVSDTNYRYRELGGNPAGWRTGFGNLIGWYGHLGAIIITGFLGFLVGRSAAVYEITGEIFAFARAVWLHYLAIFSLFYFVNDSYYMIGLVTLYVVVPLFKTLMKINVKLSPRTR